MGKQKFKRADELDGGEYPDSVAVPLAVPEPDPVWVPVFRTYLEGPGGANYLAEIQQEVVTKEIRAVRV